MSYLLSNEVSAEDKDLLRKVIDKYGCHISDYGELLTEKSECFHEIKQLFPHKNFWENEEKYSVLQFFPERLKAQQAFLEQSFLTFLKKESVCFDVGCGVGEMTQFLAASVQYVDGYELSSKMVDFANAAATENGINNVEFLQADVSKLQTDKKYDAGMALGVLMTVSDETVKLILANLSHMLKGGGWLTTRETFNLCGEKMIYLFNHMNGYEAYYRSEEYYLSMLNRAGFELINSSELGTSSAAGVTGLNFVARGLLFQKC